MYKIIKASKDAYIQDKWINNVRQVHSNTGLASSIDLYYLYNETVTGLTGSALSQSLKESSRGLIYFDLSSLQALTSSFLDFTDPTFKVYLSLKNIYGGDQTPSNFTLTVNPLAKSFSEGTGFDVIEYRDLDSVNWLTSSKNGNSFITWSVSGANASGSIGDSNIDFYTNFEKQVSFDTGQEDLYTEITPFVSAVFSNQLQNNGFRIAFSASIENGTETYFVKRFATRHINKEKYQPKLICLYDNTNFENNLELYFNFNNKIGIKNKKFEAYSNFISGSSELTGSNCVLLTLVTSRSISYTTTSFSTSHSKSISYNTRSIVFYSQSFTGSQLVIGNKNQTGNYYATVNLDYNNPNFVIFHSNSLEEIYFNQYWKSVDEQVSFGSGPMLRFKKQSSFAGGSIDGSLVITIQNFKQEYQQQQHVRFDVLLTNNPSSITKFSRFETSQQLLSKEVYYRVLDAYTREEIIPFTTESSATKLSYDNNGLYFIMDMNNLIKNKVYEFEFIKYSNSENSTHFKNLGYRFKVV
ncbi:MAG TPA: hypothetical protein PLP33_10510 [Leptospiraceae bacterium]|nr:hypothetical protein [Leptospiraceae bacterium]